MSNEQQDLSVMLARQPILDGQGALAAFELLFRHPDGRPFIPSTELTNFDATARVLVNLFAELGLQEVLGQYQGFLNADARFLLSDIPELLPADKITLEILETVEITPDILDRIKALKERGIRFALDDYTGAAERYKELIPLIDIVKVEVLNMPQKQLFATTREFAGKKLLAEKVEDKAMAENCKLLGYQFFQGYFFAKPEIVPGKRTSPAKLALLNILRLAMADSDTKSMEAEFKRHGDLTYNLLRLVNSAAYSSIQKISSIQHAVTILGRRQLISWLQLLIYADERTGVNANPLLQTAAMRGKTMELLAQRRYPADKALQEIALMTGLFSLIDTLLGMPKAELLKQLRLDERIENALLHYQGDLGLLLRLVEHLETGGDNLTLLQPDLEALQLSITDVTTAQLDALRWANHLGGKN
ncbi:EAL and HDOD domain-containing protein [Parvibium lacunae]|uniref:EAL domain-containing protein n=1 Tax=Parvibium lacunae TaxID=1888893 RepID=A0A368L875_9BURK|nr:HDOD domain-containing protein [Parvibium lacunae]RCS59865.1 EAL domain-containing protein [Parvibium lacunae]